MIKIVKNTKNLIIAGLLVLLVLFLVVVVAVQSNTKEDYLVEREGFEKEDWPRAITKEEGDDGETTVFNHYDGYRINLSEEWETEDLAFAYEGFSAYLLKNKDEDYFRTPEDGVHLNIKKFDKERRSVVSWLASSEDAKSYFPPGASFETYNHPAGQAYKTFYPIPINRLFWVERGHVHDRSVKTEDVYEEKNGVIEYIIEGKNSVFIVSCTSAGDDYEEYLLLCTDKIQSFELL